LGFEGRLPGVASMKGVRAARDSVEVVVLVGAGDGFGEAGPLLGDSMVLDAQDVVDFVVLELIILQRELARAVAEGARVTARRSGPNLGSCAVSLHALDAIQGIVSKA